MWVSTPASYSTMSGRKQATTEGSTSPRTLLQATQKSAAAHDQAQQEYWGGVHTWVQNNHSSLTNDLHLPRLFSC